MSGPARLRILLVEDDPVDALLISEAFSDLSDFEHELVHVERLADGVALACETPFDVVLLDLGLPGSHGVDTFERFRRDAPDLPVLVLTALDDTEISLAALHRGAQDYLIKREIQVSVLRRAIRYAIERHGLHIELQRSRDRLTALAASLERRVAERTAELEAANHELEAFSYSVSHDLRAPLRAIDGFGQALLEDCADRLDEVGIGHLDRVFEASRRMAELIDDLLRLARVAGQRLERSAVDLASIARETAASLQQQFPERTVHTVISDCPAASADPQLMKIVLENLLGNAWKFTAKIAHARVEFGAEALADGDVTYYVRDNGAGFDMAYAAKLFGAFQRLHATTDFEGTGVGLATVQRIINRHGGRVWGEGAVDGGATFRFSLQPLARDAAA